MTDPLAHYAWRYLHRTAQASHALADPGDKRAICGAEHLWLSRHRDWLGTGSQTEYDRVGRLPRCKRCVKKASR